MEFKYVDTNLNSMTLSPPPNLFPTTINVNGVSIRLYEDGSWDGNKEALFDAISKANGHGGMGGILLWLLVNAINNGAKQNISN